MSHDKPKYLDGQPKERSGVYTIIAIGLVLAIALFGAWRIYIGTVIGWDKRFNSPDKAHQVTARPLTLPPRSEAIRQAVALHQREQALRRELQSETKIE